jgi:thioredoxin
MKIVKSFVGALCVAAMMSLASCSGKADSQATDTDSEQVAENGETTEQASTEAQEIYDVLAGELGEKLASDQPVVIDFNATWCGPCKQFTPTFYQAKSDYDGKVQFLEVDIDKYSSLAENFGVESIPMVVLITPNGEIQSNVGLMSKDEFYSFLDKNI